MAQPGRVRIRVTDTTGAVIIPNAEASLLRQGEQPILIGRANEDGEILLADIPFGDAQIRVTYPGFKPLILTGIRIVNTNELKLDAKLEVGFSPNTSPIKRHKRWWIFGSKNLKKPVAGV